MKLAQSRGADEIVEYFSAHGHQPTHQPTREIEDPEDLLDLTVEEIRVGNNARSGGQSSK
jgi:hypothetical protein